jgi:translation initiation factor SUI1
MNHDPFGDDTHFVVDITVKQRNGRKMMTHIANIPEQYDIPKILKYMKKIAKCGGAVLKAEDGTDVIQLAGDQRQLVCDFLVQYNVMDRHNIRIHGF